MPIFGKEVKTIPNEKPETVGEVYRIPIGQLHPHPENPYGIRDDPDMLELTESVRKFGVLCPAIARPRQGGGYELIAGHRRKEACERVGLDFMPVMILNLDDNDAIIQLVDGNIQRENILPSERAKAYKLRMEAIKRKAGRPSKEQKNYSPNHSAAFRSDDTVGQGEGVSGDTVRNYISLLNLTPQLLEMVDKGTIALTPAYQLTHLAPDEQEMLLTTMDSEQATPSVSQAQRLRKLSQSGELNEDSMLQIMMEQKKPERNDITLSGEKLRKYFPRSYSPQRIEETIFKLLDAWMRKRQRDNSR
ncbi:MAG: ParB/RepB/Spo0J family partition protein [Oscillospiraceae bacterium]|nr:ParB/RepB/Spo0J family partition protein [Oscillospiraceae bacterium]